MEDDQYAKYQKLKFEKLKPVLDSQYHDLVACIERETRQKLIENNIQFDVPAEYFSYLDEEVVKKKREVVEENMKQTEVRTFFQRKVFNLVRKAIEVDNFEEYSLLN
jgi:hypothetical protein